MWFSALMTECSSAIGSQRPYEFQENEMSKIVEQRPTLTRMNPDTMPDAGKAGYSQITTVEPGRLAFISGQVAWRRDGGPQPESLQAQADIVMENADAALAALGATAHDLVMVKLYVVDLTSERQDSVMPALAKFFDGAQPSLTGIGVTALAGQGLEIEMEMVVRLPD
jgi:enamine deaminase RidA (YjgF/YER057c/UK114 family)